MQNEFELDIPFIDQIDNIRNDVARDISCWIEGRIRSNIAKGMVEFLIPFEMVTKPILDYIIKEFNDRGYETHYATLEYPVIESDGYIVRTETRYVLDVSW